MQTTTETAPTASLTALCRVTLARLAHGASVRTRTVPAAVRRALQGRRLVAEHTQGLLAATHAAHGYAADPSTFYA